MIMLFLKSMNCLFSSHSPAAAAWHGTEHYHFAKKFLYITFQQIKQDPRRVDESLRLRRASGAAFPKHPFNVSKQLNFQ